MTYTVILVVVLAATLALIVSTRSASSARRQESKARATAEAEGRLLEFTARQIEDLANVPQVIGLVAFLGVVQARLLGIAWPVSLAGPVIYLVLGLWAVRWVRKSARREPAVVLAALGVVLTGFLFRSRPATFYRTTDWIAELAVFLAIAVAPGVRAASLTFRYQRLLQRGG